MPRISGDHEFHSIHKRQKRIFAQFLCSDCPLYARTATSAEPEWLDTTIYLPLLALYACIELKIALTADDQNFEILSSINIKIDI